MRVLKFAVFGMVDLDSEDDFQAVKSEVQRMVNMIESEIPNSQIEVTIMEGDED